MRREVRLKETPFASTIREHLELRERNAKLEGTMPLERYRPTGTRAGDPADRTRPSSDLDDTAEIDGPRLSPSVAGRPPSPDGFGASWSSPRSFDWGE